VPTYQYACTACGHELEAVQSFTDDPLTQCPACEGRLRKLFGSVGVVFKGPGFYRTDSRAGANGSHGANGSGAGKSAESGATGSKTESKSDGKADSSTGAKSSTDGGKPEKTSAKAGSGTASAA
jgi:putative FmdB family regulatory protein